MRAEGSDLTSRPASDVVAVVLAAGLGKRMRSRLPKVLHAVGGVPMVLRVLRAVAAAGIGRAVVVVGNGAHSVQNTIQAASEELGALRVEFAIQAEQRGTGHATMAGLAVLRGQAEPGTVLVLPGDTPLLQAEQLGELLEMHRSASAAATLLTALVQDPGGYGRIVRDGDGRPLAIVEERDATAEQRRIQEVNAGVGCFERTLLERLLDCCTPANAQGEIYLTDVLGSLVAEGRPVQALPARDAESVLGVNDRLSLASAEAAVRRRVLARLMLAGVTVVDPATTWVDERAQIEPDTVLWPETLIEGPCRIGSGCVLGPGTHIRSSRLGPNCEVRHSVVEDSDLDAGCRVGPFSHIRPGCRLGEGVEVGNFAEVKNATVGAGTKQMHHSYIGDADVGSRVNIGAGVITVNFDGRHKHRTVIDDGAFVGCNANLVAPVRVGAGGFVAAGTTVTRPVDPDALVIGRVPQVQKTGWARRRLGREAESPVERP